MKDPVAHKPAPTPWQYNADDDTWKRHLLCRFCGARIQRRGLLRRWRHVS